MIQVCHDRQLFRDTSALRSDHVVGVAARDVTFDVGCVAKALSMGLVFRRCFMCSAGKSGCAPVKLPLTT